MRSLSFALRVSLRLCQRPGEISGLGIAPASMEWVDGIGTPFLLAGSPFYFLLDMLKIPYKFTPTS